MKCEPNGWMLMAQLLTPVVLGLVGFWFTRRQIEISRDKLRLDHFDKRFAVFEAAREFLGKASTQGAVTIADENRFLSGTRGATFLFEDQQVKIYLDELLRRLGELSLDRKALENAPNGPERQRIQKKILADLAWLRDQYDVVERTFRPHLQLKG